jgi:hypothetical protein
VSTKVFQLRGRVMIKFSKEQSEALFSVMETLIEYKLDIDHGRDPWATYSERELDDAKDHFHKLCTEVSDEKAN